MNKLNQIKALFPLKGRVSQDNLDRLITNPGVVSSIMNCIGAYALKEALGDHAEEVDVYWGNYLGDISLEEGSFDVGTEGNFPMMDITTPVDVIFEIVPEEQD